MPYPDIPDGYELVKLTEKANGKRDRQIRPISWKETTSEVGIHMMKNTY